MPSSRQAQLADALLKQINQEEKGKLTVFLGAAPGVGKTYAMLSAAKEQVQQQVDVVVGLLETHGRAETQDMLNGFEVLPRLSSDYKNTSVEEFDLDAALARNPSLILVDELAHTNAPSSRHKRRYQDIAELLAAGIDVYTTVNIQHLVSLNDLVLQITGIRVQETVPDYVLDNAYDIRFIDLPASSLIDRLKQGKVYLPEYAQTAMARFFSHPNLIALRELAMKKVIERVDAKLADEQETRAQPLDVILKDQLLVLISAKHDHQFLIRLGRQIAERRQVPWLVLWVDCGKPKTPAQHRHLSQALTLAQELGARVEIVRGTRRVQTILSYIGEHRINAVLLGTRCRKRLPWQEKRLYQQLIDSHLPVEVSVYPDRSPDASSPSSLPASRLGSLRGHLVGLVSVVGLSPLMVLLQQFLSSGNLVLPYVLIVLGVGLKFGARPALATACWSFLSFNFFLTDPKLSLNVYGQDDIATLIFLIVIGLASGPVASRIRTQITLLQESNRYTETLRDVAQTLAVASDERDIWQAVSRHIAAATSADCFITLRGSPHKKFVPESVRALKSIDDAVIDWTLHNASPSGRFTDTLSAASITALPICHQGKTIATAVMKWSSEVTGFSHEDRELVDSILQQASNGWQRVQLARELESARVKTEVEQLRSALLSSVSHDLKSPLSSMMGAAETLKVLNHQLPESDKLALVDTLLQESCRLDSYIQNLLDMTRLGHGTLKIERDWVSAEDIIGSTLARLRRYFPDAVLRSFTQSAPPLLYVHAALIEQALFNILENAIRYSPLNAPIDITLTMQGNDCLITIEDRGPSIPDAIKSKVFDMFFVASDRDRKAQSTGMGLAICKGMLSAHGGNVSVHDRTSGKGTRFDVRLPLSYPDQTHVA